MFLIENAANPFVLFNDTEVRSFIISMESRQLLMSPHIDPKIKYLYIISQIAIYQNT